MQLWEGCVDNDPYSYNYCQNQKKSFKWCIRNYDFHKMFSFKKLKAEAAATGLANRYFWSKLIGIQTCSVQVSCIENAFEMRPVLNHNLHSAQCTHNTHCLRQTVYDLYSGQSNHTHLNISLAGCANVEESHCRLSSSTRSIHIVSYATQFNALNFPIVDHDMF